MNKQPTYYAIHYNRPDFVELQHKLSQILDYKLVIVNNGKNKSIEKKCKDLKVYNYIETANIGTLSHSHGNAINQVLPYIDFKEPYGLIDHDIFIVSRVYMKNYDILSWKQENVADKCYLWPGLIICNQNINLSGFNFLPGIGIKGDTGCDTHRLIDNHRIKWADAGMDWETFNTFDIQHKNTIIKFNIDNKILGYHYINGSNWANTNNNISKNDILIKSLRAIFPGIF